MAKSIGSMSDGSGPPDPANVDGFSKWLRKQPRQWSIVIACRAALRMLPLLSSYHRKADAILPVFRAAAISRFAAKYPNSEVYPTSRTVEVAARAASFARTESATTSEDVIHVVLGAAARAADAAQTDRLEAAYAAASAADAAIAAVAAAAAADAATTESAVNAAVRAAVRAMSDEIRSDAGQLLAAAAPVRQMLLAPLWVGLPPARIGGAWQGLTRDLRRDGTHWSVWIDWYDDIVQGVAGERDEYDAAFTDIPGRLPWEDGAEAVNIEIARRLAVFSGASRQPSPVSRSETLARLAKVASPQPALTGDGKLDVVPNQPFDVPTVDDDLVTLPLRQMNLIKIILSDLARNAPPHLRVSLKSYQQELKARGVQPILPLLKDDADIIAAAVHAPRAEDEWLEPGQRKAFERFDELHGLFVKHFPLDVERETLYVRTGLDEAKASGKELVEPFEKVAEAAQDAHRSGAVTDDFLLVVERMTELSRVLSTQSTIPAVSPKAAFDLKVSSDDRVQPVTIKKRIVFGSLGFYAATLSIMGSLGTIATLNYGVLASRLREAVEALSRFIQ